MKSRFAICAALLLFDLACASPARAATDVFVGVDDATNLGAGFEGPQLLHYSYDSATFTYGLAGHTALPAGSTVNSIALSSSLGSSGGIFASIVGATNELREYSFDHASNSFSNVRSISGTHSEVVLGSDDKLYGFDSSTGNLNYYTANGSTFTVSAFQTLTDVGGTQQLAAHPTNGSIFAGGLNSDNSITEIGQWNSGLASKVGFYPAGILTPSDMTISTALSPITNQPMFWMSNDNTISLYQPIWTFDTPFLPSGDDTQNDFKNFTVMDSMDTLSDGTMVATGYFDFTIFGGQDGNHIWALEGGTAGVLAGNSDPIRCEPGTETTSGCFRTVGGPEDKFLLSVDEEDTIHVLGAGIVGAWKYDSTVENEDIQVVAAIHAIDTLGNPTAIATATAPPTPVVDGDYNKNLVVDAADYVLWRSMNGQSVTPGSGADGTGPGGIPDGFVDNLDYEFWMARFGNTAGSTASSAAPVPEPSAAWLLFLGLPCALRLARRQTIRVR